MAGTPVIVPDFVKIPAKAKETSAAVAAQVKKKAVQSAISAREAGMAKNFATAPATPAVKAPVTKTKTSVTKAVVKPKSTGSTSTGGTSTGTPDMTTQVAGDTGISPIDTSIDAAYSPLTSYLAEQAKLANERYAKNASNITSIFGTLSDIRLSDIPKIQQQYATSLQQQQDAVAQRMAMQNAEAQSGQQGAATAAGELGSGGMPAPTSSMSGGAYTASNTDANAYQTTWNALQQVMSAQQQENARTDKMGYDYQKVATLENLQKSLEDRLAQLSGSNAQVLGDVANAKIGARQSQAQLASDQAIAQARLQNALQVAGIRAAGQQGAASTSAGARITAAQIAAAAKLGAGGTSTKSIADWETAIGQVAGTPDAANQVRTEIANLVQRIQKQRLTDPANAGKSGTAIKVTPQDIMTAWVKNYPNFPATGLVQEYLNKYY